MGVCFSQGTKVYRCEEDIFPCEGWSEMVSCWGIFGIVYILCERFVLNYTERSCAWSEQLGSVRKRLFHSLLKRNLTFNGRCRRYGAFFQRLSRNLRLRNVGTKLYRRCLFTFWPPRACNGEGQIGKVPRTAFFWSIHLKAVPKLCLSGYLMTHYRWLID